MCKIISILLETMNKNVVFITFLYNFSIFITQKKGKSFNTGRTIYLIFARFYRCFFKTVRQSVYCDRISGCAASRYIVHGRCEIEDWANSKRKIANIAEAHEAGVIHKERTARNVRTMGNCPFFKPHIHPIYTFDGFAIISI